MTEQEFVDKGMQMVAPMIDEHGGDQVDHDCTVNTFQQCFRDGFTLYDAIRYARHTEHVNPHLPEDYACRRLSFIASKYRTSKVRKNSDRG